MSRPKEHIIKYTEEGDIAVPSRTGEAKLAIRRADWGRIKRLISNIPSETNVNQMVYTILFSVGGAIAISLYPIYTNPNVTPLIFSLYMWFAIFSFAIAVIFCIIDKISQRTKTDHIESIQKDINEIESTFKAENSYENEDIIEIELDEKVLISPISEKDS